MSVSNAGTAGAERPGRPKPESRPKRHGGHAATVGTRAKAKGNQIGRLAWRDLRARFRWPLTFDRSAATRCRIADHRLLRLRLRYVSKAPLFVIKLLPRRSKIKVLLEFQGLTGLRHSGAPVFLLWVGHI
jgi:hypothetical protein